jgi:hypothetical protein
MRSLATRDFGSEISQALPDVLAACKVAGFDLIVVETSGIGQGDAAIVPLVDIPMYVMTPEFGAASQLEKIDTGKPRQKTRSCISIRRIQPEITLKKATSRVTVSPGGTVITAGGLRPTRRVVTGSLLSAPRRIPTIANRLTSTRA